MKRLFVFAGLLVTVASTCLQAQTMNLLASIPFQFRVGSAEFPSGTYSIKYDQGGVVLVREIEGHKRTGMFLTVGTEAGPSAEHSEGTLSFNRYGDSYYLSKFWTSDAGSARALIKTSRELELASRVGLSQTASVALRKQ